MEQVGVRALRQKASELLRMVEGGETIEITDRGRPVAILAPLPSASPLDRLRLNGDMTPATVDFEDLPEPQPSRAAEFPSAVLARLRRDER
jgi:prevent-host-death family protein